MGEKKLNGTVIVTYRCNARCTMCNRYKAPSKPDEEISIETIKKLPKMYFTNITGGEPFIREDLPDIVRELYKKSDRIVISTNGFFTDRIIRLCEEFPKVGIRISIEGLEQTNTATRRSALKSILAQHNILDSHFVGGAQDHIWGVNPSTQNVIDKYNDIDELSKKMKILFENIEMSERFGKNAKEWAKKEYNSQDYYEKLIKIYKKEIRE